MNDFETLYRRLFRFQNDRETARETLMNELVKLKGYEGSAGFTAKKQAAINQYNNDVATLQSEIRKSTGATLQRIQKKIEAQPAKPPSADEMRLLEALKMRKAISREDLEDAAQAMKDSPSALAVVREIAHEFGIVGVNTGERISKAEAKDALHQLANSIADFIDADTTKASRLAANYQREHYGAIVEPTLRPRFETMTACYKNIANFDEDDIKKLQRMSDGD